MTLVERAIELDDDLPDNICPGCGNDITGWQNWRHHYSAAAEGSVIGYARRGERSKRGLPWPFTDQKNQEAGSLCVWDRDFLVARAFRRSLIAGVS